MVRTERHYTNADDWVLLNKKITHTACRIYMLAKGRTKHETMAFPEHGFRVTAEWFVRIMDGMFSAKTVREALKNLTENGALKRRNENIQGGGGGEYEFVVDPGEEYDGFLSVFDKEKSTEMPFNAVFKELKLTSDPAVTGDRFRSEPKADSGASRPRRGQVRKGQRTTPQSAPELIVEDDLAIEEEPEFDMSGLNSAPTTSVDLAEDQQEFAAGLEEFTGRSTEPKLRLLRGQCERIAMAARPALERGWEPEALVRRLASELNPKIHSPEQLLVKKLGDVGSPPPKRRTTTLEAPAVAPRAAADEMGDEARERVEAAKARYQETLRARRAAGGKF